VVSSKPSWGDRGDDHAGNKRILASSPDSSCSNKRISSRDPKAKSELTLTVLDVLTALREPNKEIQSIIEAGSGRVLKANDGAISTIALFEEQQAKKPRRRSTAEDAGDEFGEGQWKVFTSWVQQCSLAGELIDFAAPGEESFLAGPIPAGVPHPLMPLFGNDFTPEDDEALKLYGLQCKQKGFKLESSLAAWEHVTKQLKNRLSRFTAVQLRDRYITFGNPSPKLKKEPAVEQSEMNETKQKLRSATKAKRSSSQEEEEENDEVDVRSKKKRARRDEPEEDEEEEQEQSSQQMKLAAMRKLAMSAATTTAGSTTRGNASKALSPAPKAAAAAASSKSQQAPPLSSQNSIDSDGMRADSRYSKEESEKMIQFARENVTLSQTEIWTKAFEENLCPGRTIASMRRHYRILNEKINRTQPVISNRKNFTGDEDEVLFLWIYQWLQEHGKDGIWGRRIWEAAESQQILPERTAEMMHNRFHNSLRKRLEDGLENAKNSQMDVFWSVPKSPRKVAKPSQSKSPLKLLQSIAASPAAAGKSGAASSTTATVYKLMRRPDELMLAVDLIDRVRAEAGEDKPMEEVVKALYFTCANERAAVRVLLGEDPDSKFDVWTPEEDRKLKEGQALNRPDVHRRRVFLGLEPRVGL